MSFDHIRGEGHTARGREFDLFQRVKEAMTAGLIPVHWEYDERGFAYACRLGTQKDFPEHAKSRGTSDE